MLILRSKLNIESAFSKTSTYVDSYNFFFCWNILIRNNINKNIVAINQVAEEIVIGVQQTTSTSEEPAQLASHLRSLLVNFKVWYS